MVLMQCVLSLVVTPKPSGDDVVSVRTQQITTSRHLLISAADAIERIMSSYKEVNTQMAMYIVSLWNEFM